MRNRRRYGSHQRNQQDDRSCYDGCSYGLETEVKHIKDAVAADSRKKTDFNNALLLGS
jgi:hypothetical protein